jgi:hypothetical protein
MSPCRRAGQIGGGGSSSPTARVGPAGPGTGSRGARGVASPRMFCSPFRSAPSLRTFAPHLRFFPPAPRTHPTAPTPHGDNGHPDHRQQEPEPEPGVATSCRFGIGARLVGGSGPLLSRPSARPRSRPQRRSGRPAWTRSRHAPKLLGPHGGFLDPIGAGDGCRGDWPGRDNRPLSGLAVRGPADAVLGAGTVVERGLRVRAKCDRVSRQPRPEVRTARARGR